MWWVYIHVHLCLKGRTVYDLRYLETEKKADTHKSYFQASSEKVLL